MYKIYQDRIGRNWVDITVKKLTPSNIKQLIKDSYLFNDLPLYMKTSNVGIEKIAMRCGFRKLYHLEDNEVLYVKD